jgi:hypothetical protein
MASAGRILIQTDPMYTTASPHQADKTVIVHGAKAAVAAATTTPTTAETISRVRAETRKPPDDDADRVLMVASSHRRGARVRHGRDGYAATMEGWTAAPFVPDTDSLAELQKAAAHCTGCPRSDVPWASSPIAGRTFEAARRPVVVTYHPSAVLRAVDDADEIREAPVADIRRAAGLVA